MGSTKDANKANSKACTDLRVKVTAALRNSDFQPQSHFQYTAPDGGGTNREQQFSAA